MAKWRMRISCCVPKATHTHIHNMQHLLLSHYNIGSTNVPQCYVIRTLPVLLSRIMYSGLLLGVSLSVDTCWSQNMATITSWPVSMSLAIWSYQCSLCGCNPIPLQMWECNNNNNNNNTCLWLLAFYTAVL